MFHSKFVPIKQGFVLISKIQDYYKGGGGTSPSSCH